MKTDKLGCAVLMAILGIVSLVAVGTLGNIPPRTLVESETDTYEILEVDPPKRVYVTLKNQRTEEVYPRVYVSKRFYNWTEKLAVGRKVNLTRDTYIQGGTKSSEFRDLQKSLE